MMLVEQLTKTNRNDFDEKFYLTYVTLEKDEQIDKHRRENRHQDLNQFQLGNWFQWKDNDRRRNSIKSNHR